MYAAFIGVSSVYQVRDHFICNVTNWIFRICVRWVLFIFQTLIAQDFLHPLTDTLLGTKYHTVIRLRTAVMRVSPCPVQLLENVDRTENGLDILRNASVCEVSAPLSIFVILPFSAYSTCGQPGGKDEPRFSGRVAEGSNAKEGAWPWQALLIYNNDYSADQV